MDISIKGLTRLFAHPQSYTLELDGGGCPIVIRGCDVVRYNSYVELIVNQDDSTQLLITIPMTSGAMERALSLENSISRVASTLFTSYRVGEVYISSCQNVNECQLTKAIIQQIPQGELLSDFLEGASAEQIHEILGAAKLLDESLHSAKASFATLKPSGIVVGDDGLLYPFRYHKLTITSGDEPTIVGGSLVRWIEHMYGVNGASSVAPVNRYYDRDLCEGHLYLGSMHEDRMVVEDATGFGYVDGCNHPVIASNYIWVDAFREGRAEVEGEQGFGLIDTDGNEVIPTIYESLGYNHESGITAVRHGGKWAYFSYNGEQLTPFEVVYPDEDITLAAVLKFGVVESLVFEV